MNNDTFYGFIKYYGPGVEAGEIEIEKAGKALLAFDRIYKGYSNYHLHLEKKDRPVLKFTEIKEGSVELGLVLQLISDAASSTWLDEAVAVHQIAKASGIDHFGKGFFSALGNHVALSIFSKGNSLTDGKKTVKENEAMTEVVNKDGEKMIVPLPHWESYKFSRGSLAGLIQLEKGHVEKLEIGYRSPNKATVIAEVTAEQKDFFIPEDGLDLESRMAEPFDESKAKDEEIVGVFVDFHGLARKYHFSFQARKKQEDVGKQKILCIVEKEKISEIIDYLKPEKSSQNIKIFGKATRDAEGRIDKIKITDISEDLDLNPYQKKMNI